jgi:hypothetical protein
LAAHSFANARVSCTTLRISPRSNLKVCLRRITATFDFFLLFSFPSVVNLPFFRLLLSCFGWEPCTTGELFDLEVSQFACEKITVAQCVWEGRARIPKPANALRQVDLDTNCRRPKRSKLFPMLQTLKKRRSM